MLKIRIEDQHVKKSYIGEILTKYFYTGNISIVLIGEQYLGL